MTSALKIPYFVLDAEFNYTVVEDEDGAALEDFFDAVADHLAELGAEDISIVLDEFDRSFSVSLLIGSQEYESIETVVGKGMGMVRTALHVCNARTPGWPNHEALLRTVRVAPASVIGQDASTIAPPMLASV